MINEQYKAMLSGKSVIRELSEYATARGAQIGYENVFDFSLGNPSVPVPRAFNDRVCELLNTRPSMEVHGYSPSLGIWSVREKIAASLTAASVWTTARMIFSWPAVRRARLRTLTAWSPSRATRS